MSRTRAVVYCVSDANNFPGLVGLLNSLRIQGHQQEIVVLDVGLRDGQREALGRHARVLSAPAGLAPFFVKYALPPTDASVRVICDADVIITRPLDELIDLAAATGRVVAFADDLAARFHPNWSELLDLDGLEPRPYVNAGVLFVPDAAASLLDAVLERSGAVDYSQTIYGGGPADAPFLYFDQDVLNAVLAAPGAPEVIVLEHRLAPHPPFRDLSLVDKERLLCRYPDGAAPYVLHHVLAKPWSAYTRPNIYGRFLRRLLLDADVELRLKSQDLPVRLRNSHVAVVARLNARARASMSARRARLGLRARLRAMSHRVGGTAAAE